MKTSPTKWLLACGAAVAALAIATSASAQVRNFNIPSEDAVRSIPDFARQAGIQIVAPASRLNGVKTPALRGQMDTRQALTALLRGTGLQVANDTGSVVTLRMAAPAGPATPAAAESAPSTVTEVIVTAEKRKEDVRKISGSISAYTGQQLETLGAQSLEDYLTLTPGVAFNADIPGESRAVIRGVATTTEVDQGQGTVGYFINDIPLTDPYFTVSVPDIDAFDVDNVSVLRGPQGTLFGSASLGGSINYEAAKPNLSLYQVHAQGTIDAIENGGTGGSGKLMVNLPVVNDTFAIRAVYVYRDIPGYIDNIGTGQKNSNTTTIRGGRIEATWKPTPSTTINYMFLDELEDTADLGYQQPGIAGPMEKTTHFPEFADFKTLIHNLRIDQDLGFGVLTATATYHEKTQNSDGDDTSFFGALLPGIDPIHASQYAYSKGSTFEVRLASNPGRIEYLIGAMRDDTREDFQDTFHAANAEQVVETDWSPVFGAGIGALGAPNGVFFFGDLPFHGQETAAFGEATYHFNDQWKITLGGREFETESHNISTTGGFFDLLEGNGLTNTLVGTQKETGFTPKASITWTPDSDFMAYALVSKGFRFGGPNINPSTPANPIPATFASDSLVNYEAGVRSTLFDRRLVLDATAFYIDWSNIQLRLATPAGLAFAENAGKAINYGVETTSTWRITDHLSLKTNLTYLEAALTEDFNPGAGQPIIHKGSELPGTAKWQVSDILSYDRADLPTRPLLILTQRYASNRTQNYLEGTPLGGYSLFDARATFHLRDDLSLSLYVDNIGNDHAFTSGSFAPGQAPLTQYLFQPRTVGVTLDFKM